MIQLDKEIRKKIVQTEAKNPKILSTWKEVSELLFDEQKRPKNTSRNAINNFTKPIDLLVQFVDERLEFRPIV